MRKGREENKHREAQTWQLPAVLLYIVHFILYSEQCILFTVYCILYTVYCTLYFVQYILCTLYNVQYILYTVHCILYTLLYTLYTVLYTVYIFPSQFQSPTYLAASRCFTGFTNAIHCHRVCCTIECSAVQ